MPGAIADPNLGGFTARVDGFWCGGICNIWVIFLYFENLITNPMAKSVKTKQRAPQFEVQWKDNVPEVTYFNKDGYSIVAKVENGKYIVTRVGWDEDPTKGESIVVTPKDTLKLMDNLKVKNPDTLIRVFGKKFALKEPHKAFFKIKTSLERRGIPYEIK